MLCSKYVEAFTLCILPYNRMDMFALAISCAVGCGVVSCARLIDMFGPVGRVINIAWHVDSVDMLMPGNHHGGSSFTNYISIVHCVGLMGGHDTLL